MERTGISAALICFKVIDTGIGIDPRELPYLFEPFVQTVSHQKIYEGTGLGLALSRQFVRLMGGELTATSQLGWGSCFTFTLSLPSTTGLESVALPKERLVLGLEPHQPVCRILIVDDRPDNRAPLRALLEGLNPHPPVLEFREAANGQEAVTIWETWQPHVIFMDMRMPLMSGEDATRTIKARMAARPDTVQSIIVALTASAFNENREYFLACGCDEFASKPFQADELFHILEHRAGVRLFREAEHPPAPALSSLLSADQIVSRLATCPDAWQVALREAVALGDFDQITALVEQIHRTDSALHEVLSHLAYNSDLEAFTRALEKPGDEG